MHSAPSVSYPVGRSYFMGALLLLAWLLGAAVTILWWSQSQSWRPALGLLALGCAGLYAAWRWWNGASGVLSWDGEGWSWSGLPGGDAGIVDVSLDLQHWLLLRWRAGGASEWVWLERANRPERWDDLRRAVYSRASIEALPEPGRPAAKP